VTNLLHAAVPSAQNAAIDPNLGFSSFNAISALYNEGVKMTKVEKSGLPHTLIPCIFGGTQDVSDQLLHFGVPDKLFSAGGIIELSFSPQKYSMELSSFFFEQ
jgi:hypothetical protein